MTATDTQSIDQSAENRPVSLLQPGYQHDLQASVPCSCHHCCLPLRCAVGGLHHLLMSESFVLAEVPLPSVTGYDERCSQHWTELQPACTRWDTHSTAHQGHVQLCTAISLNIKSTFCVSTINWLPAGAHAGTKSTKTAKRRITQTTAPESILKHTNMTATARQCCSRLLQKSGW